MKWEYYLIVWNVISNSSKNSSTTTKFLNSKIWQQIYSWTFILPFVNKEFRISNLIMQTKQHRFYWCFLTIIRVLAVLSTNHTRICRASLYYWYHIMHPIVNSCTVHRKWSFPSRISSVNATKSAFSCEFSGKTLFFVQLVIVHG